MLSLVGGPQSKGTLRAVLRGSHTKAKQALLERISPATLSVICREDATVLHYTFTLLSRVDFKNAVPEVQNSKSLECLVIKCPQCLVSLPRPGQ